MHKQAASGFQTLPRIVFHTVDYVLFVWVWNSGSVDLMNADVKVKYKIFEYTMIHRVLELRITV